MVNQKKEANKPLIAAVTFAASVITAVPFWRIENIIWPDPQVTSLFTSDLSFYITFVLGIFLGLFFWSAIIQSYFRPYKWSNYGIVVAVFFLANFFFESFTQSLVFFGTGALLGLLIRFVRNRLAS